MTAVERIDDAMSRIEAYAMRPVPAPPPVAPGEPAGIAPALFEELRDRHATMRGRVQAAIAELDTVLTIG